ncbi:hypothetical protein GX48_03914 [Paracoccidioides brasiliensis]|nr:hypothetical protein GX48_03914 [Paracoccidioides brasiliensis]
MPHLTIETSIAAVFQFIHLIAHMFMFQELEEHAAFALRVKLALCCLRLIETLNALTRKSESVANTNIFSGCALHYFNRFGEGLYVCASLGLHYSQVDKSRNHYIVNGSRGCPGAESTIVVACTVNVGDKSRFASFGVSDVAGTLPCNWKYSICSSYATSCGNIGP